ncbi:MAG: hypothetical protein HQ523_13330 [Lentisphaerae bacterium]|nr:hypothetical protein [Lentisphaerota bacterium]
MHEILSTVIVTTVLFGLAFAAMAVGLFVRGKIMRGGCGSSQEIEGGCDSCSKKALNLCDEEDKMGLAGPSFTGTLGRFSRKQE